MTIFVELTTSPLEERFKQVRGRLQGDGNQSTRAGRSIARRPTRGMEVKNDTYATLRVVKADGRDLPLVDSGAPDGYNSSGYANFLLQTVQEARMEKHQVIETFGASYVFFFGEQPRFLDCTALLLNSHDFNWEAEWWANYNTYLRGTKLVEMGARCYLSYDDNVVEGYMVMAQASKTGDQHLMARLQFKFFVTNCFNTSLVGNPNFPIRSSVQLPDSVQLTSQDAGRLLTSNLRDEVYNRAELDNFDTRGQIAAQLARKGLPGAYRSISQLIRETPASVAVSADWWPLLLSKGPGNLAGLMNLVTHGGTPLRGLIASNTDEYVGYGDERTQFGYEPGELPRPPSMQSSIVRSQFESADLFRQAIEYLSCYGADVGNPTTLGSMGMGPSFSSNGFVGASFGPSVGTSFGFSASTGVGLGAVAGGGFGVGRVVETNTGASTSPYSPYNASDAYQTDSLGVVYGSPSSSDVKFGSQRQGLIETGFDFNYGYDSPHARGPGYGKAGFGDYGGSGFGSGNSQGDPGFRSPDDFQFVGVGDNSPEFEQFVSPRTDRTALTRGRTVGRGELSGGASNPVGGKVSAFSLVSIDGDLDPTGMAREDPRSISNRMLQVNQGYLPANPYGVSCPNPGLGSGDVWSTGVGFSAGSRAGVSVGASVGT